MTEDRVLDVQVPDGKGGWKQSRANLKGMCVIDEPTLDFYRDMYEKTKSGQVKTGLPAKTDF